MRLGSGPNVGCEDFLSYPASTRAGHTGTVEREFGLESTSASTGASPRVSLRLPLLLHSRWHVGRSGTVNLLPTTTPAKLRIRTPLNVSFESRVAPGFSCPPLWSVTGKLSQPTEAPRFCLDHSRTPCARPNAHRAHRAATRRSVGSRARGRRLHAASTLPRPPSLADLSLARTRQIGTISSRRLEVPGKARVRHNHSRAAREFGLRPVAPPPAPATPPPLHSPRQAARTCCAPGWSRSPPLHEPDVPTPRATTVSGLT